MRVLLGKLFEFFGQQGEGLAHVGFAFGLQVDPFEFAEGGGPRSCHAAPEENRMARMKNCTSGLPSGGFLHGGDHFADSVVEGFDLAAFSHGSGTVEQPDDCRGLPAYSPPGRIAIVFIILPLV